jgi:hypothetical protein
MVTTITGARSTYNINSSRVVVDMSQKIYELDPDTAPLLTLTGNIGKSPTHNPKFEWMEDDFAPVWDAVNNAAGITSSDTTIEVDNWAYFEAGQLVKVPRTGEVMRVTEATASPITVVRGIGSSSAAALVDNEPLLILGDSNEEGASSRDAKTIQVTNEYNYTQIFRTTVEATETNQATELYGGPDRAYQRKKKGIEHTLKMERQFWFGERSMITTGTHPRRTTGGVLEYISDNFYDAGGMLTESEWENFLDTAFTKGSKIKWGFMSGSVISIINLWAKGRMEVMPKDKTYGLSVVKYTSPHGELNMIRNRLFTGATYGGYCVVLDFEDKAVQQRVLRDTKFKTNIQDNDADSWKDEYITEAGLEVKLADRHAVLYNITS